MTGGQVLETLTHPSRAMDFLLLGVALAFFTTSCRRFLRGRGAQGS
jgi:hypothetical protein